MPFIRTKSCVRLGIRRVAPSGSGSLLCTAYHQQSAFSTTTVALSAFPNHRGNKAGTTVASREVPQPKSKDEAAEDVPSGLRGYFQRVRQAGDRKHYITTDKDGKERTMTWGEITASVRAEKGKRKFQKTLDSLDNKGDAAKDEADIAQARVKFQWTDEGSVQRISLFSLGFDWIWYLYRGGRYALDSILYKELQYNSHFATNEIASIGTAKLFVGGHGLLRDGFPFPKMMRPLKRLSTVKPTKFSFIGMFRRRDAAVEERPSEAAAVGAGSGDGKGAHLSFSKPTVVFVSQLSASMGNNDCVWLNILKRSSLAQRPEAAARHFSEAANKKKNVKEGGSNTGEDDGMNDVALVHLTNLRDRQKKTMIAASDLVVSKMDAMLDKKIRELTIATEQQRKREEDKIAELQKRMPGYRGKVKAEDVDDFVIEENSKGELVSRRTGAEEAEEELRLIQKRDALRQQLLEREKAIRLAAGATKKIRSSGSAAPSTVPVKGDSSQGRTTTAVKTSSKGEIDTDKKEKKETEVDIDKARDQFRIKTEKKYRTQRATRTFDTPFNADYSMPAFKNVDVVRLLSVDLSGVITLRRTTEGELASSMTAEQRAVTYTGEKIVASFMQTPLALRNYLVNYVLLVDHTGNVRWASTYLPTDEEFEAFPKLVAQLESEYLKAKVAGKVPSEHK